MHRKLLAAVGAVALLLGAAGCSTSGSEEPTSTNSQQQGSEPDLSGIPKVVAEVNGVKITKDEFIDQYKGQFQQMQQQAQSTGEDVDEDDLRKQTAEGMVNTELLLQEADSRDIDASKKELDKSLKELADQNQLSSKDEALKALKEQGLDKDAVYDQLKTQVRLDKLIAEETGDIEPSKKELKKLYEQAESQQKQSGQDSEMPSFEDAKPQLKEQAKQQKQSETSEKLIKKLRKGADISMKL